MTEQNREISEIRIPSKRLLGRLKNVYDHCQLTLVGGEFDGRKAKSHQFARSLPTLRAEEVGDIQTFNDKLVETTDRMLLSEAEFLLPRSIRLPNIEGLGGYDFQNVPDIATQVALGRRPSVVIRLVFGATEQMPYRALSYLLPALTYIEHVNLTNDVVSQLQVIFVNNISSRLDHLDTQVVKQQAKKFAQIGKQYTSEFFPDVEDKVVFLEDTPLDKNSDLRRRLVALTQTLRRIGPEDIMDDLVRKAANNGGGNTYAFYGAAHILIHDIDLPDALVPLLPNQPERVVDPEVIISIGGRKEETFYRLRYTLKPHLDPEYSRTKTLQFFTNHSVSPYYMARGGDISLDDVLSKSLNVGGIHDISKPARKDIDYLELVNRRRYAFHRYSHMAIDNLDLCLFLFKMHAKLYNTEYYEED